MVDKTVYKVFNLFAKGYETLVCVLFSVRQNWIQSVQLFAKGYVFKMIDCFCRLRIGLSLYLLYLECDFAPMNLRHDLINPVFSTFVATSSFITFDNPIP